MASFVKLVVELMNRNSPFDDTVSDRFNHVVISSVLILSSILITSSQYVGDPIQCWMPREFNKNQGEYVEDYCWVHGTYYLPFEEENVPSVDGEGRRPNVTYYQWLPLILLIQALLYGLGHKIWGSLYIACGLDLENYFVSGKRMNVLKMADQKDQVLQDMASVLERYLIGNNARRSLSLANTLSLKHLFALTCFRGCSASRLNYLVTLLIFVKTVYVVNAVVQFFLLAAVLNTNFWIYGISFLRGLVVGDGAPFHSWPFPKVTMCDFKVRRFGNLHNYSVQCALMVNLFTEKIYIIIWFLMIIGLVVSIVSLIKWSVWAIGRGDRYRYVINLLLLSGVIKLKQKISIADDPFDDSRIRSQSKNMNPDAKTRALLKSQENNRMAKFNRGLDIGVKQQARILWFVRDYLRPDGVLILHLLEQATNRLTAMEVAVKLWTNCAKMVEPASEH